MAVETVRELGEVSNGTVLSSFHREARLFVVPLKPSSKVWREAAEPRWHLNCPNCKPRPTAGAELCHGTPMPVGTLAGNCAR